MKSNSAGPLKRPGLTEILWLVASGEINAILCTWYDRLTRSRDFYVLDKEFRSQGIEFHHAARFHRYAHRIRPIHGIYAGGGQNL